MSARRRDNLRDSRQDSRRDGQRDGRQDGQRDGLLNGGEGIDAMFRQMAARYVDKEGDRLRAENEAIAAIEPFAVSKGFNEKVYSKIRREKYTRAYYALGAVAACLMVAFIGIVAMNGINGANSRTGAPASLQAAGSMPGDAAGGAQGDMAASKAAGMPPAAAVDSQGDAAGGAAGGAAGEATIDLLGEMAPDSPGDAEGFGDAAAYEAITLSFRLPANLSVTDVKQDRGQTVFYIDNAESDDIVLIAEMSEQAGGTGRFDGAEFQRNGLRPISINNVELYAVARADYSYVTFQSEGVIYSATCRHDYRTLMSLCEYIL